MRHPAAPAIIAVLLGFLIAVVLFHVIVDFGHHEGNPRMEDVPLRLEAESTVGESKKVEKDMENLNNEDEIDRNARRTGESDKT